MSDRATGDSPQSPSTRYPPRAAKVRRRGILAVAMAFWWVPVTATVSSACPGDCDEDRIVTIAELTLTVGIALGQSPVTGCVTADANEDGTITINEIVLAVRNALGGCPPLPTPTPPNLPPEVTSLGVYRTYPGYEIELAIQANDPEGGPLGFTSAELPDGATLDPTSGVLHWIPAEDKLGAYEIGVDCTDEREATTRGEFLIKVSPLDGCTIPDCDPRVGCQSELASIDEPCCTKEPLFRVAEPAAGCPEGLVMFAGRNEQGFGRLQNCDYLRIRPFAQGDTTVRFHLEARCVDATRVATLHTRMATADAVLFDQTEIIDLQRREDGFAQHLALFYRLPRRIDPIDLEGVEAQLDLRLTDADGVVVSESLRLTLTSSSLADLPDPDREDIPAGEGGCIGCHRPQGNDGERVGIEEAHPWADLTCTDCHGGNGAASTLAEAHVSRGDGPSFIRNLASDELDRVPAEYLRFINPGDLRVVGDTCGRAGCHVEHARAVPRSVMSTYVAHYTLPRYLAGSQDREPIFGAVDISNPDFDPETAPPGTIDALTALREPDPDADRATIGTAIDVYLPKSCPTCHLNSFGPNNAGGKYRSSGCTACHMVYADNGLSRSQDPTISPSFPPRPITHELTTAIPAEQCAHCHFQGGRIGLAFRGIREGGFSAENTPENGVTLGKALYGHDSDYYFSDEDSTNGYDETPPDLHFTAGMVCVDCHVGGDVHGDGNLYASERHQVGVRCEDCHGTVRATISEDPTDGSFKNSKGFPLKRLAREDDQIWLQLATRAERLRVPQIHTILERGFNPAMTAAMGVNESGFSHTDKLECYTCHTSWRQTCFGCHVTVDDRGTAKNHTTGETSLGAISAQRDDYSTDFYALGVNQRGKISPLCNSMSILMSYIDADGNVQIDDRVRTSGDGKRGFGWNPFHHHTVSRTPQSCTRCHPAGSPEAPTNESTLRATYGFGDGSVLVEDGAGEVHDLTGFLDEDGELRSDFPHPNTGPVPREVRDRALSIQLGN